MANNKVIIIEIAGKGGICHYTFNLARELGKLRPVEVLTGIDYELKDKVKNFKWVGIFNHIKTNPLKIIKLLKICRHPEVDVVHIQLSQYPLFIYVLCSLIKVFTRKRIVLTAHNVETHEKKKQEEFAYNRLYVISDKLIVHAQANKELVVNRFKINPNKISVVPHGNYTFFSDSDSLGIPRDSFNVLFFGYIRQYKGLMYLIKAMKIVKERVPQARLIIAGKAVEDFSQYKKAIVELKLEDSIETDLDYISFDKVRKYFSRANVVAMPYENIYQSGVVQVAYGFRRPVVATNVGGFPEAVDDGLSGFIVEPRDVDSLADKLSILLSDFSLQERMGDHGLNLALTKFSWWEIAHKTLGAYGAL